MESLGKVILEAEDGWKRIEQDDAKILYSKLWERYTDAGNRVVRG